METSLLPKTDHIVEPRISRRTSWPQAFDPWLRFGNERARITGLSILLGVTILLAVVWFSAPYFARDYINRGLSGLPDYTGRVERVRIHPWNVSLDLYDVHLDKRTGNIPVHFFYAPRWNVSLQWSQVFHGVERASVTIFDPQFNLVEGPSPEESQMSISQVWFDAIKALIPWRVNQVRIHRGEIHYLDFHADPPVDLEVNQLEYAAENMSNSEGLKVPLPSTVKITARPLLTGTFTMNLAVNFDEQYATFTQDIRMEQVPAAAANAVLQNVLKVRVKSGEIGLDSQMTSDKGIYHGYVKPFFSRLEFEPKPGDEGNPGAIWSGILNAATGLFANDNQVIARQRQISGRLDRPHVDAISAITAALEKACIEALRPGFGLEYSPTSPTDTVTSTFSAKTENKAALLSPAAENQ
jgi:hypothetical protein